MKILHSSDWHIGHTLCGKKRYPEFSAFLSWLLETLSREQVDLLIVAGDIFDSSTPGSQAQTLYYDFLSAVKTTGCRHVILVAGNHDSPSLLEAPAELLKDMGIHVVGESPEQPPDTVILLRNQEGEEEAVVCGIPYLRETRMRGMLPGESLRDKQARLLQGIRQYYQEATAAAFALREEICQQKGGRYVPVIATGHLFVRGGYCHDEDGMRELYVGTLAQVACDAFPVALDYLALGHLHREQIVGRTEHFRYSGAPLTLGFGDVGQTRAVTLVDLERDQRKICSLPVPEFQSLLRIRGDTDAVLAELHLLIAAGSRAWVEIEYTGEFWNYDLRDQLAELTEGHELEILRIRYDRGHHPGLFSQGGAEELSALAPADVFSRCLLAHQVSEEDRVLLEACFGDILLSIDEEDGSADEDPLAQAQKPELPTGGVVH
ncbi:MAG: exonuclease SbcCD subunit D C-terminal domain-containing protein [Deltaproteobacteria bacterium]|nr:exonuclease SbcCD subunit D C-terminal domain-containing protein [Deltaproteobacteria bacterium]